MFDIEELKLLSRACVKANNNMFERINEIKKAHFKHENDEEFLDRYVEEKNKYYAMKLKVDKMIEYVERDKSKE